MGLEDAVKVEWEQLPQREMWLEEDKAVLATKPSAPARDARPVLRPLAAPLVPQPRAWEYLDHTADVQIHSWGSSLEHAFAAAVIGMFAYMVELEQIPAGLETDVAVQGHDMNSLLYNFMDECLYLFHTEGFAMKQLEIRELDLNKFSLTAVARGGAFDATRHAQGTEVKAITYSNMQIITDDPEKAETFVIVDI